MGLQVGVSVQEDNALIMGVEASGRVNKERQKQVFSKNSFCNPRARLLRHNVKS